MTYYTILVTLSFLLSKYHFLWKFKLVIDLFYVIFKSIYKYLGNIIIFSLSSVDNRFLRIDTIVKTFYVITKRVGCVFLIFICVRFFWIWFTCVKWFSKGFKICIYNERNSHRSLVVFKF